MTGTSLARADHMSARLDTMPNDAPSFRSGMAKLVVTTIVIAAVWLVLLPWWSRQPAMARHLEWLDDRGIDPSAMFYTELEAMEPILRRLERSRN